LETEIARIVESASPFLVSISAETQSEEDGCRHRKIGSGVVIDSTGYVLTTADVVKNAQRISVTTVDGDEYVARLFASDRESKLVLLKTAPQRKSCAALADSDRLKVGQWAIILANSMGVTPTVAIGLISGFRGNNRLIQVTAFALPGNSGAPVFDSDGQLIGIVTAAIAPSSDNLASGSTPGSHSLSSLGAYGSSAIMLAVPANRTREIANRMLAGKPKEPIEYGWLGVTAEQCTTEPAEGVRVVEVVPGSPAERASIRPNDIILEYDGQCTKTIRELVSLVKHTSINRRVEVQVRRDDQEIATWVRIGRCPLEILAQQRQ
jgi:serine protease Do